VLTRWPPTCRYTTVAPPSLCRDLVGTDRTSVTCLTMSTTPALPPAYSPGGLPVTSMTTGNIAVPPADELASTPTEAIVPNTRTELPVGVIVACNPFLSCGRSALLTLAWTTQASVVITVML